MRGPGEGGSLEESWRRWQVELDDEAGDLAEAMDVEDGVPVPVDPPPEGAEGVGGQAVGGEPVAAGGAPGSAGDGGAVVPWSGRSVQQRPVVPAWLRTGPERRAAARYGAARCWHLTRYHVVRVPLYGARLTGRAPAGARRAWARAARWVGDAESAGLAARAAKDAAPGEYLQVVQHRRAVVRARRGRVARLSSVGLIAAAAAVWWGAWWVLAAVAGFVVVALGVAGRNPDRPVVDHAVVTPRARRLSADVVLRAFVAAKLCTPRAPVTFAAPIARDGAGWRAVLDLPYGVTAEQAIKRRTSIASGLDLDEVQVWPERVRGRAGSARRLSMWVADEDPYAKASGLWPWLSPRSGTAGAGGVSVFEAFPFGQDQRGRPVDLVLMFTWLLVAAIPRMGKTFAARLAVLAAALDPFVQLWVYDGKGGADWRAFAPVAHRLGLGAREDAVQGLLEDLRGLRADMDRRYDVLGSLPIGRCPEGKVTPDLARDKSLGLFPVLLVIDEFQRYAGHPVHGEEIVDQLTELAKVGPAAGIMGVLATQKPDPISIPTRFRDVVGTRFCLKVMNYQSSDAALGAGAYSSGYDASRFQRSHKGVGWLLGADDSGAVEEAATVRTFLAGPADIGAVIDRARAAREKAGTLSGQAAGQSLDVERVNVLADVRAALAGEDKLWNERIIERLDQHREGYYQGWAPAQLTAALKPYGVTVRQVHGRLDGGGTANRRGVHLADVETALRALDRATNPGGPGTDGPGDAGGPS